MSGPRVLLFDIETAPLLASVWSCWKQNVGLNQIKNDWYMLSWSAKWLGEDEVMYMDCRDCGLDDKPLLEGLHKLLDEADWTITHNGDKFDLPKVKSRMLLQGLDPFSPVKSIDTCKIAKKDFAFTSNKLEYLSGVICPEHKKLKHSKFPGFELWKECLMGNEEAWDEMEAYNRQDVIALEGVYLGLLGWSSRHPNYALWSDKEETMCPKCGSTKIHYRGYAYTGVSKFRRFQCQEDDCKSWGRVRVNQLPKEKMKSLGTTIS